MKLNPNLEIYRIQSGPWGSAPGSIEGCFQRVPGPSGRALTVVASTSADPNEPAELQGWEHVSVSIFDKHRRLPNWEEMDWVKRLFWDDEECVVQFHPPRSQWVNNAPVLHLWRSREREFPMPNSLLVGVKEIGEFKSKADADRAKTIADQQVAALHEEYAKLYKEEQ